MHKFILQTFGTNTNGISIAAPIILYFNFINLLASIVPHELDQTDRYSFFCSEQFFAGKLPIEMIWSVHNDT